MSLNGGFSVKSHCTLYGDTAVEEKQGMGDKNKESEGQQSQFNQKAAVSIQTCHFNFMRKIGIFANKPAFQEDKTATSWDIAAKYLYQNWKLLQTGNYFETEAFYSFVMNELRLSAHRRNSLNAVIFSCVQMLAFGNTTM